jgi:nitroreductase
MFVWTGMLRWLTKKKGRVLKILTSTSWYCTIKKRRSRRRFDLKPLETEDLSQMASVCAAFRPFRNARSVVVTESPDKVFKGAIGPYGKLKGAPAFIGNMDSPNVWEQVGYTGECIILEAEALNLATYWMAGFFRPKVVASLTEFGKRERVLTVTPIGLQIQ